MEDDVPVIDLVAGDEAVLEYDVEFSGAVDVNPDPTITVINDAPVSDLGLDISRPPILEWRDDDGPCADLIIDGGPGAFNFVDFIVDDAAPDIFVNGVDIGATDAQIVIGLVDFDGDAILHGILDDLPGLGPQFNRFELTTMQVRIDGETPVDIQFQLTDINVIEIVPPSPDVFTKFLIDGPDRNGDGEIDVIIEAHSRTPSTYTFRIEVNQPDLPPMEVSDHIPKNWDIVSVLPDNPNDFVLVDPQIHPDLSGIGTTFHWYPTENAGGLNVTIKTASHHSHFQPRKCGRLWINHLGASAWDTSGSRQLQDADGNPLVSNSLFIGAMKDKDHDGVIDWSGNGDEDEDSLTDAEEIFTLRTDPCKLDTDHDHVDDGNDRFPLDRQRW